MRWLEPKESGWTLLVRLMVGLVVFFPEGIQKLLFPAILGAGRFAKIGIPWPDVLSPFVGVVEAACGALIIVGLATRLAAIPLIVIMIVAIMSTKIPILTANDFGIFHSGRPRTACGLRGTRLCSVLPGGATESGRLTLLQL